MSDLIERLRRLYVQNGTNYLQEAADEIERLRAVAQHEADCAEAYRAQVETMIRERDELKHDIAEYIKITSAQAQEIERLTAERDELRRQFDPMGGKLASADELIAALRAEKEEDEAMKRDARRYRWLRRAREHWDILHRQDDDSRWIDLHGNDLDAAIDAAMGGSDA